MRLSAHFRSEEFDCHNGAEVPPFAYSPLRDLCRVYLEPLRALWGPVTIISGYRPAAYNAAVGGAPRSRHIYRRARAGVAADIRCARGEARDWYRTLDRLGAGGLGYYSHHVHVDNRAFRARW